MKIKTMQFIGLAIMLLFGCSRQDKDFKIVQGEYYIKLHDGKGLSVFSDDGAHVIIANVLGGTSIVLRKNDQELLSIDLKRASIHPRIVTTYVRDGNTYTVFDTDGDGVPEFRGVSRPGEGTTKETFVGGSFVPSKPATQVPSEH